MASEMNHEAKLAAAVKAARKAARLVEAVMRDSQLEAPDADDEDEDDDE